MRTSQAAFAALAVMFLLGAADNAFAAVVAPGGVVTDPPDDTPLPQGELVDEDVREVTFTYIPPTGFGFVGGVTPTANVTFRSQVYRDATTLSFVYSWEDLPADFGREGGTMTVSSFADFTTDVSGALGGAESTINRSADGNTIQAFGAGEGLGTVTLLLVETDASEYNESGSFSMDIFDRFDFVNLENPQDLMSDLGGANATLAGVFQPTADDGGPGPGPGNPIPLPAGVWAGMALLGGTGIVGSMRRQLARRRN